MDSDVEDELDARNVAQRRSIEDAPRRRLRVMGVSPNVSQVCLSQHPQCQHVRNSSTVLRKI